MPESKRDQENRDKLEALRRELNAKAIADHVAMGPPSGCGHGCIVGKVDGMATNGRCHCDSVVLRRALRWYRFEHEHRDECDAERMRVKG